MVVTNLVMIQYSCIRKSGRRGRGGWSAKGTCNCQLHFQRPVNEITRKLCLVPVPPRTYAGTPRVPSRVYIILPYPTHCRIQTQHQAKSAPNVHFAITSPTRGRHRSIVDCTANQYILSPIIHHIIHPIIYPIIYHILIMDFTGCFHHKPHSSIYSVLCPSV